MNSSGVDTLSRSISIAVPDSLFVADDTLRDKTIKLGDIARPVAIFGVERIYIYRDPTRNYDANYEIARSILEYLDTPQYLRKRLIGKKKELEYVGLLPPLRTPSHRKDSIPQVGEFRDGVMFSHNGVLVVDVGAKELAKLDGRGQEGQRATFEITSLTPLIAKLTRKPEGTFWGFEVRRAPSLARFLRSADFDTIIFTSRLGNPVSERWNEFRDKIQRSQKILVCFGSPDSGIDKFLKQEGAKVTDFETMYLNMFPSQFTETVRLEEAVIGTLAILNLAAKLE